VSISWLKSSGLNISTSGVFHYSSYVLYFGMQTSVCSNFHLNMDLVPVISSVICMVSKSNMHQHNIQIYTFELLLSHCRFLYLDVLHFDNGVIFLHISLYMNIPKVG